MPPRKAAWISPVLLLACACLTLRAWPVEPSPWHAWLLEAVEKIPAEVADPFPPFESPTFTGGQPSQSIRVPLNRADTLYLFVTGCPDAKWAVADWAGARLIRTNGAAEHLTTAKNYRVLRGRHEVDLTLRAGLYQKMRLGGRVFDRGLCVQADSVVEVQLDGEYAAFEATIGVDDWAETNGSVRFSVVGARAAARKRLLQDAARRFPDGLTRQEIAWELDDRIFERDWLPGQWRELAERYAAASGRVPPLAKEAARLAAGVGSAAELGAVRDLYLQSRQLNRALEAARSIGPDQAALRGAIEDLEKQYPDRYPKAYSARLEENARGLASTLARFKPDRLEDYQDTARLVTAFEQLKSEALLANPLLDFEKLMVIKRVPSGDPRRSDWEGFGFGEYLGLPRQSSWGQGTMPNVDKWTNEIAVLSPPRASGKLKTLFKPDSSVLVGDVDLHWDGAKMLFSMPDRNRNWQVCEVRSDGTGFRQLTPSGHADVHNYDPIYLPGGSIIFLSTAPLQGVPCNSSVIVGMMYAMGPNGDRIHQLTFEQDHDYTPSVLNNGRVLYLRWDYTDTPHIWNRVLMSMNPDGTGQMEYYGGNSYWPNAIFYARALPNEESKFVGIVTGHHEGRVGELFVFDPGKGRHETNGVVQRIPRRGPPVAAKIEDKLTEHSWPKFLHPWPLNDKYFLVSCKPSPDALWGIYLVDVFDNSLLLKEEEGVALLEPVPLAARPKPPVIQDRTQPGGKDALVYIEDIYQGPGLKGIPRGTVKRLRVFTYHFGYQKLAGIDHRVGADGPWEAKRVLGTVPVEEDGSALFTVPAKMPLSIQPLDSEGKAVALMRSWMTAMPGESLTCVGCHERQSTAPPGANRRAALGRAPSRIEPQFPPRGFSFHREVQPVLDRYCVGCHDGQPRPQGPPIPDLRGDQGAFIVYRNGELDGQRIQGVPREELLGKYAAVFEPSYVELRKFVRVGGLESDLHLLNPKEFHADTSELIQMLRKGHHGVVLNDDAWARLVTWIDLNAPCHGRWGDVTRIPGNQCQRRLELRKLYGGVLENWEDMPETDEDYETPVPVKPVVATAINPAPAPRADGWPFDAVEAQARQKNAGPSVRVLDVGNGLTMEFVRIPAGAFVMGDRDGAPDEQPEFPATIERPFWMSRHEVSNEQFRQFNPAHDSRFEHRSSWIFSEEYLGWPLNRPRQPVVRVSWQEALDFCAWLSEKTGAKATLPTETQWEYACRAGTPQPLSFGAVTADFSPFANLGDASLRRLADEGWRPKSPDLVPREDRYNDGMLVSAEVGQYQPNAWGLHDMHGNVAEWTRSEYRPYPLSGTETGPADRGAPGTARVVRGGSWRERPKLCRSASRLAYPAYQKVFNVGFRVVILDP